MLKRSLLVAGSVLAVVLVAPSGALAFGPISSFGSLGGGAGQVSEPEGIAVDADGDVYVADYGNNRVDKFAADGSFLSAFGSRVAPGGNDVCTTTSGCVAGEPGEGGGALNNPTGITTDSAGNVYVTDSRNNRVEAFSADGTFMRAFGKEVKIGGGDVCTVASECQSGDRTGGVATPGALQLPMGIRFEAPGELFVANFFNDRIEVYSTNGTFLRAFGKEVDPAGGDVCTTECQAGESDGSAGSMERPADVAVAADGRLAVADYGFDRVDVFSPAGEFLRAFGEGVADGGEAAEVCTLVCQPGGSGEGAGAMSFPWAEAIDASGHLMVGDLGNSRIDEFNLSGGFIRAFGAGVVDGAQAFQICTATCQLGNYESIAGATPEPYGLAFDSSGALDVSETLYEETGPEPIFARIERFNETAPAPAPGPAPGPAAGPAPGSTSVAPSNHFSLVELKLNRRNGTAVLSLTVPGAGAASVTGKGVRKAARSSAGAGTIRLPIRLLGKARKRLDRIGAARVSASVSFAPSGGTVASQVRKLTLRKALQRTSHSDR